MAVSAPTKPTVAALVAPAPAPKRPASSETPTPTPPVQPQPTAREVAPPAPVEPPSQPVIARAPAPVPMPVVAVGTTSAAGPSPIGAMGSTPATGASTPTVAVASPAATTMTVAAAAPTPAATTAPAAPSVPPPVQMAAATTVGNAAIAVKFKPGSTEIGSGPQPALDAVARRLLGNENLRVQLISHATGGSDEAMEARRISLARAIAVRRYLIDKGVLNLRIDVRALGNHSDEGPATDQVDLLVVSQ